jgi:hypothetical protein
METDEDSAASCEKEKKVLELSLPLKNKFLIGTGRNKALENNSGSSHTAPAVTP